MRRRVGGLETELGLVCVRADGSRALEPEAAARELFRPVVAMGRSSNVFLRNAARLYLDVGSHPEYATAECDDWWDLVAQDRAGERVLADLVDQANVAFRERGEDARIHLIKNNEDSAGNSFGSHENYLVDRRGEFTRLPQHLLPFLVTRQIITGSGGVVTEEGGAARFVFSRRSDQMWEAVSSATTRTRPIINTRDEPHGDPTRFRRLHVIVGDSTMSEVSTHLRFATTDLVLRLIESGRSLDDLRLQDPITAIRAVSRDLTGQAPVALEDGRTLTALEIQRRFRAQVERVADDADAEVLETWDRALDAVETGDRSWAATHLDWAIKERLLTGAAQRHGLALDSPQIQRLEMAYHDIDRGAGLFFALQRRGQAPSILPEERIEAARTTAPTTTRAHLRGQVVTAAQEAGVDHVVDWTTLRLSRQGAMPVQILDPFETENAAVERLLAEIRAAGA
ncbi:Pup--protein ligase [Brachybacterium nesterenkovii]|uniref:Pup--protein ligase n=1 Tax=Brachybacterium nesterenkovii TaxID=47847 RepID=A0A1X6WUM5_9MICO|nr:Pup--protein ligase [Brachybacterium nesterenkovii]SLM88988.1 Pup ligase PafA, possible component of postulated heterodimer PafA-PafA' [Brachybacterium nesterenkovii]